MNKILSIDEVRNVSTYNAYDICDGFAVVTESGTIYVLISNEQNCCENWGYFDTNDDSIDFIDSDLLEVKLTDTALNTKKLSELGLMSYMGDWMDLDEGGIQFVDFITSNGTFQLAVYNSHNGYYGHAIYIMYDREIMKEDSL